MLRWGRHAAVFVNGTRIARVKGIRFPESAKDHALELRDLKYALHLPGNKDAVVVFEMLDDDEQTSFELLKSAFIQQIQTLNVQLVVDAHRCSSPAIEYVGVCLKFETEYPESGPSVTTVVLAPTGVEESEQPTRTTWTNPDTENCIP